MRRPGLAVILVTCACAGRPSVVATAPRVPQAVEARAGAPRELWVDPEHGNVSDDVRDGSRARPLKTLAAALAAVAGPTRIHLSSGLYPGPFVVPAGTALEGGHATVLHADVGQTVIRLGEGAALSGLTVQGGTDAIETTGDARLARVRISGFRRAGVVHGSGRLEAAHVEVTGTVSDTVGVDLASKAHLDLRDSSFRGGLRDAVRLGAEAQAVIVGLDVAGPVTAVRSEAAVVELSRLTASGGRGPCVWLMGGTARLRDIRVEGHEFGVLGGSGVHLEASGLTFVRPQRAGLALADVVAEVREVLVVEGGTYGGIQIVGGEVTLRSFLVAGAQEWGLALLGTRAVVSDGVILRVVAPKDFGGDGVVIRRSRVRLSSVSVRETAGAGILVANGARVVLRDLLLEQNKWGGVIAESLAYLEGASIFVRNSGGAALAVPDEAVLKVDLLLSADNVNGAVWAECTQGAQVFLSRVKSADGDEVSSRCVGEWTERQLFDPLATDEPAAR